MCFVLFSRQTFITLLNRPIRSTTVLWEAEPEVLNILNLELQRENGPENYNHSFQGRPSVPFRYKINVSDITRLPQATFIGLYVPLKNFGREGPVREPQLLEGRTDGQTDRRRTDDKTYICFVSYLFHLMRKTRTTREYLLRWELRHRGTCKYSKT
jgi:hypothetical protein